MALILGTSHLPASLHERSGVGGAQHATQHAKFHPGQPLSFFCCCPTASSEQSSTWATAQIFFSKDTMASQWLCHVMLHQSSLAIADIQESWKSTESHRIPLMHLVFVETQECSLKSRPEHFSSWLRFNWLQARCCSCGKLHLLAWPHHSSWQRFMKNCCCNRTSSPA